MEALRVARGRLRSERIVTPFEAGSQRPAGFFLMGQQLRLRRMQRAVRLALGESHYFLMWLISGRSCTGAHAPSDQIGTQGEMSGFPKKSRRRIVSPPINRTGLNLFSFSSSRLCMRRQLRPVAKPLGNAVPFHGVGQ
jgi:hypothetical protein